MDPDWEDCWTDDWENVIIPDLLVSVQNKERELKLLEERKLMEDADLALSEELFNDEKDKKVFVPVKKEKPKDLQILQEQKRKNLQEKQQSQKQKEKKHKELFGEAEFDEYEEMYGHLEDHY